MARIRVQRIEKELLRLISNTVTYKLRDKNLAFVSITRIRVSNDLSDVKVYFSHYSDTDHDVVLEALTKSTGFIKKEIAAAKFLRMIPEITFFYDTTEDNARDLEEIFDRIEAEKEKQ